MLADPCCCSCCAWHLTGARCTPLQADPYCRLWLRDGSKKSTSVRGRTVNPRWNEHFTLIVHSAAHQVLNLVLYDSGAVAGTLMFLDEHWI